MPESTINIILETINKALELAEELGTYEIEEKYAEHGLLKEAWHALVECDRSCITSNLRLIEDILKNHSNIG